NALNTGWLSECFSIFCQADWIIVNFNYGMYGSSKILKPSASFNTSSPIHPRASAVATMLSKKPTMTKSPSFPLDAKTNDSSTSDDHTIGRKSKGESLDVSSKRKKKSS